MSAPIRIGLTAIALLAACRAPSSGTTPKPAHPSADERSRTATADDWKGTPTTRPEELFAGRFPGVRVMSAPGGITVRVRGLSTINGDTGPLYVIDGMAVETGPNGLLAINPNDIAKIEILKDIGQTSYYGVRGANGVVLITTKR